MNQLATKQSFDIHPQELDRIIHLCGVLATCPFYQKLGPGGVLAIYMTAREYNLPPMMCLNGGMYTFSGAVSLSAELMNMMIVNAGHRVDVLELTDEICKLKFVRGDRKTGEGDTAIFQYTIQEAHRAGLLNKNNWKTNPSDMLFNRALSRGARKFMPDVTKKAYTHEEMEEIPYEEVATILPPSGQKAFENSPPEQKKDNPEVKLIGHDEFFNKQFIEKGASFEEFVKVCADKANMSTVRIINSAMQHSDVFEQKFIAWRDKKTPKVQADTQTPEAKTDQG